MPPSRFVAAIVLAFVAASASPADDRPNILLIYVDDLAYQAVSAYGSRLHRTPNIDQIAVGGMRFDHCYVTNSICAPARAALLTGKYSHRNGVYVNGNTFDGSQPTFPKLLQAAGYQTALIGKWHLVADPTGFDYWDVLVGQGPYYNPEMIANGQTARYMGYTTEIITERTLAWLRERRDPKRPFLLMYQHKAPHRSFDPGPAYMHLYEDEPIPEPPTLFEDYSLRGAAVRQQDMTIAETLWPRDLKLFPPGELNAEQLAAWNAVYGPRNRLYHELPPAGDALVRWKFQRFIKDYLRCVAAVDNEVGRVLKYLDDNGLTQNTIVIFTSDQGFYLGEHGWFDKRFMYEQSLRTPLLIRWPGVVAPGSNCEAIVSNLDFAPTFLEIAGVERPADVQGRSFLPLLKGTTPDDWRTSFYYHYYEYPGAHHVRRHYGVTDSQYKLIHFYEADVNEWELYDLRLDPNEISNVYENAAYAKTRERMHAELKRLRAELEVPEVDPPDTHAPPAARTRNRWGP